MIVLNCINPLTATRILLHMVNCDFCKVINMTNMWRPLTGLPLHTHESVQLTDLILKYAVFLSTSLV